MTRSLATGYQGGGAVGWGMRELNRESGQLSQSVQWILIILLAGGVYYGCGSKDDSDKSWKHAPVDPAPARYEREPEPSGPTPFQKRIAGKNMQPKARKYRKGIVRKTHAANTSGNGLWSTLSVERNGPCREKWLRKFAKKWRVELNVDKFTHVECFSSNMKSPVTNTVDVPPMFDPDE